MSTMLAKSITIIAFISSSIFSLTAMDYSLRNTIESMNPALKEFIDQIDIRTDKSRADQNTRLLPYTTPVLVMNELAKAPTLLPTLPKDISNKILMIFWDLKINTDESKKNWSILCNTLNRAEGYFNIKKDKKKQMILDSIILTAEEITAALDLATALIPRINGVPPQIPLDLFKKVLKLPSWFKNNFRNTTIIDVRKQISQDSCLKQMVLNAAAIDSWKTRACCGALIGAGICEKVMRSPHNSNTVIIAFDIFTAISGSMNGVVVPQILERFLFNRPSFREERQTQLLLNKNEKLIIEQQLKNLYAKTSQQKINFDKSFNESVKSLKKDDNNIQCFLLQNRE